MDNNQEREVKRIKEALQRNRTIKGVIDVVKASINRDRRIKDPMVRNMMFLKNLTLLLDAGAIAATAISTEMELDESNQREINNLNKMINEGITALMNWIQNPIYGPNHPYGEQMMKNAQEDYKINEVEMYEKPTLIKPENAKEKSIGTGSFN